MQKNLLLIKREQQYLIKITANLYVALYIFRKIGLSLLSYL